MAEENPNVGLLASFQHMQMLKGVSPTYSPLWVPLTVTFSLSTMLKYFRDLLSSHPSANPLR